MPATAIDLHPDELNILQDGAVDLHSAKVCAADRFFGCSKTAPLASSPFLKGKPPMSQVDLPEELVRLVEAQGAAGIEDVRRAGVAALDREQQRHDVKLAKLRAAVDEGDASGVFEGDPFVEVHARYGLYTSPR